MSWQRQPGPDRPALMLGIALAIAVCLPLVFGGRLFLLDWVLGPHSPVIPSEGLGLNGGLNAGVPFSFLIDGLVGAVGDAGSWLPFVAFFPLAGWGMARLVSGSIWRRLSASSLYCINPFIFERAFVGHFGLLVGYALLPLATSSGLRFFKARGSWLPTPALWWAVLTALSPHFAWIYGIALVSIWLLHQPTRLLNLATGLTVCVSFAIASAYLVLPHTATQLQSTTRTGSDLALYRTMGDPHLGLFGNVLGLYGFWRLGPQLPKNAFSGWPFLMLAILIVAGIGAYQHLKPKIPERPEPGPMAGRRGAAAILLIGVAGYFLALGNQGPTGPLFRWAYFHVPFFAVMREPEKFLMLTALAYAVFFGWGVEYLVGATRRLRFDWPTAGAIGLAVVLPLAYTPTIFDGLAGQIGPSQLPASWSTADRLMGNGPGQILFLPWHLYMAFPFTGGRVIANPAPTSFRRSVISGDNVEAGGIESTSTSPRSEYLQHLYAQGRALRDFGSQVAPLGVDYVILAKTVDWRSYSWLKSQTDLVPVMDSGSLEVWRNADYAGVGEGTPTRRIRQISPVAYSIGPGPPGVVTLDAVYQKGWQLGTQKGQKTSEGTISFDIGPKGGIAQFAPWGITRLGYIISGAAFVALMGVVIGDRVWRGGRNQRRTGSKAGPHDANRSSSA